MGYTRQAIKGISWSIFLRGSTRLLSYFRIAITARILSPEQFGVVAIAYLVLAFVEILTETGINIFLIQEDDKIDKFIDTAWIVSILRGIVIALIIVLTAPLIANFYETPEVYFILLLTSIVPLVRGIINPAIVSFQKYLQFDKEFYFRFSVFFVDTLLAIILTYYLKSPVGIVLGMILGVALEVILSFVVIKTKPRLRLNKEHFNEIIKRGKWVTGAGVFNYLFQNGDDFVIGKIINVTALGLYDAVYKISILPLTEIGDVVSKTLFPVYAKISDDKPRLRKAFSKHILVILMLILPVGLILYFFPTEVIGWILGSKWLEVSGVLQTLVFFGLVTSLTHATFPLLLAVKKQNYVTYITFVSFIALAFLLIPFASQMGLLGVAYAVNIASLIAVLPSVYFVYKILK